MWGDKDGDAHVRLLEGTAEDADRGLEMLAQKYDEDFFGGRWIEDKAGFMPFDSIEGEYNEYREDLAALEAMDNEGASNS
jgi:hypothetical protein